MAAMDENAVRTKSKWLHNHGKAAGEKIEDVDGDDEEECDEEAWDTLNRSFRQAQMVLDENRALIEEVNYNHDSKIPHNMLKNVGLIRQIDGNISKVLSIYSDLSVNFSNIVRQRRVLTCATVNHHNRDGERGHDKAKNSGDDSAEDVPEKSEMVELMAAAMHIPRLSTLRYKGGAVNLESREGKGDKTRIEPMTLHSRSPMLCKTKATGRTNLYKKMRLESMERKRPFC